MSELLGALFAVLVGMMYLPKIQSGIVTQRQVMADVTTAQQQQQWVNAVSAYVSQNNATYLSTATATPTPISVAAVKAANVGLPVGFAGTNPFNQTWAAAITQPSAGNLQVLVYTTGGTQINDQELGSIARAANGVGGMIPTNNSGVYPGGAATAYGAYGAWKIATASYGVAGGTPASLLNFSNGALTSNYLYRNAVPGQPQLNTMNTNFNMGGNSINNAATVNALQIAASGVTVANATGAESVNLGSGSMVHYDAINQNYSQADNGTVIANHNGSGYAPLYAGPTSVNGDVTTTGSLNFSSSGQQISNPGRLHINVGENLYLQPWSGGQTIVGGGGGSGQLEVTGHLQADQAIDSNNYIKPGNIGSVGAGCGPWGAIGSDGSQTLFCKNGVWRAAGGISSVVQVDSGGWNSSAFASCPAAYTLTGGSCDMNRGGDGREISPRQCQPSGNSFFCAENNGGTCIAHAICAQ
ncbi:shufflon system plasmid conjugative transfer pilus tip adhesin PilV [Paraburkholderia sediminicola]|uniref:shufflon system plasmid conjugative transfer pilus tip adhesin PilV n=1 Tax=Paraburkholderia sediminicola TaxID=458836 RepID=UPI0038B8F09E